MPATKELLQVEYDAYFLRYGKSKAIGEMARAWGVAPVTVRRHLNQDGVRAVRPAAARPAAPELASAYEALLAEYGKRGALTALATTYGVAYMTARMWLVADGVYVPAPRAAKRPITEPCPCGAVATTRYKGEDPPLCFRCYMRRYASDPASPTRRVAREYIDDVKLAAHCADCGEKYPPYVYHFDHVPERGPKLFNLGSGDYAIETVKAEIAKCDIVCANCHAGRTWIRRSEASDVQDAMPA